MKNIFFIIMTALLLTSCVSTEKPNPPQNEIPMYGGESITELSRTLNDKFIENIRTQSIPAGDFKDMKDAAAYYVSRGWDFFRNGDYTTAIRRFNQAWLLDETNADVYWGFADWYGVKNEYEKSVEMFEKSLSLNPDNPEVMSDLSVTYNNMACDFSNNRQYDRYIEYAKKSAENSAKALKIKETGTLWHNYAVSLYYLGKYNDALAAINRAKELGHSIPPEVEEEIAQKASQGDWNVE